ncbi:hypothetical protein Fot_22075 [Forsythia ovata]|uniref:Uncharacterized protein n=1 Tax=Forsythia ovata TaxID=205694 RepID=A0ABD1UWQ8_9LAMI
MRTEQTMLLEMKSPMIYSNKCEMMTPYALQLYMMSMRDADKVDDREVDTGIDRTGQESVDEPLDTDVKTIVEGEADVAVGTGVGPMVEVAQEEAVDTGVDTPVEGEVEVVVDTGIEKTVEGDAEKADQPHSRIARSVIWKDVQEKPKVFLCRSKRKAVEKPDVDE